MHLLFHNNFAAVGVQVALKTFSYLSKGSLQYHVACVDRHFQGDTLLYQDANSLKNVPFGLQNICRRSFGKYCLVKVKAEGRGPVDQIIACDNFIPLGNSPRSRFWGG